MGFTPSPGPSTVTVGVGSTAAQRVPEARGHRTGPARAIVGARHVLGPGDSLLLPVVGLDSCSSSQCLEPHTPRLGPRLTLDLMFLSCRLTEDLSFFKKSGLLLDFIISEGTNRPITLVSRALWNQTRALKISQAEP